MAAGAHAVNVVRPDEVCETGAARRVSLGGGAAHTMALTKPIIISCNDGGGSELGGPVN